MFSAILESMPLYIFARLEPRPGKEIQLLDELMRVVEPTRAEPGCLRIHLYESTRSPLVYFIHSEWTDEAKSRFEEVVEKGSDLADEVRSRTKPISDMLRRS